MQLIFIVPRPDATIQRDNVNVVFTQVHNVEVNRVLIWDIPKGGGTAATVCTLNATRAETVMHRNRLFGNGLIVVRNAPLPLPLLQNLELVRVIASRIRCRSVLIRVDKVRP